MSSNKLRNNVHIAKISLDILSGLIRMSSNKLRNNVLDFAPTFGTQFIREEK